MSGAKPDRNRADLPTRDSTRTFMKFPLPNHPLTWGEHIKLAGQWTLIDTESLDFYSGKDGL